MSEATLIARGEGAATAKGDSLLLTLSCSATAPAAADALAQAEGLWGNLRTVLDELGIPEESRLNSGVSVQPHHEYEQQSWVDKGWRAGARTRVRLPKGSSAAELVARASKEADANVEASTWEVLPGNPARTTAVQQAVANAKDRAEALATAAGLTLGALVAVRDVPSDRFASAGMPRGGDSAPDIGEGWVDVKAVVELKYVVE